MLYYSKSTSGFYSDDLHGENIPDDAVEITGEKHQELLADIALGKRIDIGSDGQPFASFPEISLEELAAQKRAEVQAEKRKIRDAGVIVDGVLFDSDLAARIAYAELGAKFSENPEYIAASWKASSGQWVDMGLEKYRQVMTSGEDLMQTIFAWQKIKESAINEMLATGDRAGLEMFDTKYEA